MDINYKVLEVKTYDLQNPVTLQKYKDDGYLYIRQLHKTYDNILRSPTIGSYAHISMYKYDYDPRYVKIDSYRGKKLISRSNYF